METNVRTGSKITSPTASQWSEHWAVSKQDLEFIRTQQCSSISLPTLIQKAVPKIRTRTRNIYKLLTIDGSHPAAIDAVNKTCKISISHYLYKIQNESSNAWKHRSFVHNFLECLPNHPPSTKPLNIGRLTLVLSECHLKSNLWGRLVGKSFSWGGM